MLRFLANSSFIALSFSAQMSWGDCPRSPAQVGEVHCSGLEKAEVISREAFDGDPRDMQDLLGRKVRIKEIPTLPPQELLDTRNLSSDELKIADLLLRKAQYLKFVRRDLERQFHSRKAYWLGRSEKFNIPLPENEIIETAMKEITNQEVEIGAWRLTYNDGSTFVGFATSSKFDSIDGADLEKALNGLLKYSNRDAKKLVSVQFFHNHTKMLFCNLTLADLQAYSNLKKSLTENGVKATAEIYAICQRKTAQYILRYRE